MMIEQRRAMTQLSLTVARLAEPRQPTLLQQSAQGATPDGLLPAPGVGVNMSDLVNINVTHAATTWVPIQLTDPNDERVVVTGIAYTQATQFAAAAGATAWTQGALSSSTWRELGSGAYWLQIGSSVCPSAGQYWLKLQAAGCRAFDALINAL